MVRARWPEFLTSLGLRSARDLPRLWLTEVGTAVLMEVTRQGSVHQTQNDPLPGQDLGKIVVAERDSAPGGS